MHSDTIDLRRRTVRTGFGVTMNYSREEACKGFVERRDAIRMARGKFRKSEERQAREGTAGWGREQDCVADHGSASLSSGVGPCRGAD